MKPQPSVLILSAVAAAGALLLGCEGGITQVGPGVGSETELVAAYVDPITPRPAGRTAADQGDFDTLPVIDGDAQDKEWNVAQPLFVYVSGDHAMGGDGYYVELRAVWSDESRFNLDPDNPDPLFKNFLYMLVRYADETFDTFPDYWRYARPGQLGLVASPRPAGCDSVILEGQNWFIENEGGQEDQVSLMFEIEPVSDGSNTYSEIGCQIACHGATFGAVPSGKLDVWTWRAGRTNAQETTVYPDFTRFDEECPDCGILESIYNARLDPTTNWPGYMEDMWADQTGLRHDQADPTYPPNKNRYSGQLYVRNMKTNSADGLPVPNFITEKEKSDKPSTGGTADPADQVNHGLPKIWYLWGPSATAFEACDSIATSRLSSTNRGPIWSQVPIPPISTTLPLLPGMTDVMPGYALFVPNGSAADVRAKGDHNLNQNKRFSVWTLEVRRPMMTGPSNSVSRNDDVSIDPSKEYTFTVAIFNRSSQIHSGSGPLKLRFAPSLRAPKTGGPSAS